MGVITLRPLSGLSPVALTNGGDIALMLSLMPKTWVDVSVRWKEEWAALGLGVKTYL
jgi:hypothetical protein